MLVGLSLGFRRVIIVDGLSRFALGPSELSPGIVHRPNLAYCGVVKM
jgi:hypothetical protein